MKYNQYASFENQPKLYFVLHILHKTYNLWLQEWHWTSILLLLLLFWCCWCWCFCCYW